MELVGERTLSGWMPPGKVPGGFAVEAVVIGSSESGAGLEIVVLAAQAGAGSSREALGAYHSARVGKHNTPVVVAAIQDGHAWLFGPNAKAETVGPLPVQQAQRMLQAALDETSGHAARRRLAALYEAARETRPDGSVQPLPGVANAGLFATHEIRYGARRRDDWPQSVELAPPLLRLRRQELIEALGFTPHREAAHALLLADGATSRAVAVLLDEAEHFDSASSRFHVSPVAYAIALAQRHELPWVLILRGSQLRLYPAQSGLGVGRKGLAETYFELDLALVGDDTAGFLPLIFSSSALAPNGSTYEILSASAQYAVALGERLRAQVYEQIVPRLSLAVAEELRALGYQMNREGLDLAYQLTLRIFFRLLFQAYAEDRKLLPYGENPRYDRNALNTYARDLVDDPTQEFDENSASIWDDLSQVWHVIDKGDSSWSVPAYNGGLFSADAKLNPEGALIERMSITNGVMGPVLRALLLDEADGEIGPIDFRSLSVREFGTIYEGLLESNLAVADTDLVLDERETWVPAESDAYPLDPDRSALKGSVYFHNTSGQRKGTGSYFTPSFVVEHLLEHALDPTLDEHLAQVKALLDAGDQAGAADIFFDFRVADIAMGSGHFLTAAIDRLEAAMAAFLEENPVPGVKNELRRLEDAARTAAGPDVPDPEPSSLLRRQIARRCTYGLDINPIAVELARVSIWIHTFVRGLPMSTLEHNLVCANALTGIGTVDEALDVLSPGRAGEPTLFDGPIDSALAGARRLLEDASVLAELDRRETRQAAEAVAAAMDEAEVATHVFDAAVLMRTGDLQGAHALDLQSIAETAKSEDARARIETLRPAHFPTRFPEVALRARAGFDVVIGNPPWEKLHVEEHQWWGLRFPGLRSLKAPDRARRLNELKVARPDLNAEFEADIESAALAREAIAKGPYPGIAAGHLDLYKAFAWRFWQLTREGGRIGLVLPRAALSGSGTELWRRHVLEHGAFESVVVTVNAGRWVFEQVDPRYSTAFIAAQKGQAEPLVRFAGPLYDRKSFEEKARHLVTVPTDAFLTWTGTAAFPLLESDEAAAIFVQMGKAPPLASPDGAGAGFHFVQGDLNANADKATFVGDDVADAFPIFTGASFNLWDPGFGDPFAFGADAAITRMLERTQRSAARRTSAFAGLEIAGVEDLPMARPRIAFRDICRATDSRTMIAALVPPGVALVHPAPYLFRRAASEADEAFLLGVMSSVPFDWFARRIVEMHMTFELVRHFPVPCPGPSDRRRRRLTELAAQLAAPDDRYARWLAAVGTCPAGDALDVTSAKAEIDALVASLYGLERPQVEYIFTTFHRGWDHEAHLGAVFHYFDAIEASE